MERVAFIIEETGERLTCLLNPESFVVTRQAGLVERQSMNGMVQGQSLRDTPLMSTGGGRTELELQLLFDTGLVEKGTVNDVRELTSPLHELAENQLSDDGKPGTPIVRFVWGKAWSIRCVVTDVAEHFDQFSRYGAPLRSWISLRLVRLSDRHSKTVTQAPALPIQLKQQSGNDSISTVNHTEHEVSGASKGARLDLVAEKKYGNPGYWRLLAQYNDLSDPMNVPTGTKLKVPPLSVLEGQ